MEDEDNTLATKAENACRLWSASVSRWHHCEYAPMQRTGDTTAAHTTRMLWLLYALNPNPSPELVKAVVMHDVAEIVTGDVSGQAKAAYPELHYGLETAEMRFNHSIGITTLLSDREAQWLKLLDTLDAYLWVRQEHPAYLGDPSWDGQKSTTLALAYQVGCFDVILAIVDAA